VHTKCVPFVVLICGVYRLVDIKTDTTANCMDLQCDNIEWFCMFPSIMLYLRVCANGGLHCVKRCVQM
jgi:hypothetical protein